MKNKQTKGGNAPGSSAQQQEKKVEVTSLPRMEMYAVLGFELGQKIFAKLEEVEDSVEMLARQKKRELDPHEPETETDQ